MAELNAHSERMVFIVNCKVKDTESFKTWTEVVLVFRPVSSLFKVDHGLISGC